MKLFTERLYSLLWGFCRRSFFAAAAAQRPESSPRLLLSTHRWGHVVKLIREACSMPATRRATTLASREEAQRVAESAVEGKLFITL